MVRKGQTYLNKLAAKSCSLSLHDLLLPPSTKKLNLNFPCSYAMTQLWRSLLSASSPNISSVFKEFKQSLYTMLFLSHTKIHDTIFFYTYSSTDSLLSPVPVFNWFIFCCGNLILRQKKENKQKWLNYKFYDEKQPAHTTIVCIHYVTSIQFGCDLYVKILHFLSTIISGGSHLSLLWTTPSAVLY